MLSAYLYFFIFKDNHSLISDIHIFEFLTSLNLNFIDIHYSIEEEDVLSKLLPTLH